MFLFFNFSMPDHPTPADADAHTDFQLSQEPVTPPADAPAAPPSPAPAYEYLGELPAGYGTSSVYAVAYDPRRLFAYWDLDATALAAVDAPLALRVCRAENGEIESQVDLGRAVSLLAGVAAGGGPGRYLPVTHSGATYYVELGTGGGATGAPWRALATSSRVIVPPEGLAAAEDGDTRFATLPFHLSFQRLAELLRATVQAHGRPLTEALADLQFEAHVSPTDAALVEALGRLDDDQRRNLQTVLGWEFGPSSADFLSSPGGAGGSEGLAVARVSAPAAGGSESLSSFGAAAVPTGAAGSESVSSFGAAAVAAGAGAAGSGAVTSFGAAALGGVGVTSGGGSGGLTSVGVGGSSSEAVSALGAAPSSAAMFAARAAAGSESAAAGLGRGGVSSGEIGGSAAFLGARGAGASGGGASGVFGPAPSSEAWRRAVAAGAVAGSGGSDQFVRERAERFLRAITSSLDVLSPLFSGNLVAGATSAGGSPGR